MALYLNTLLKENSSYSVVSSAVYSIKWAHALLGHQDPTDNTFVHNLLEGAKRTARQPVCKKEPITSDMLVALCNHYRLTEDLLVVRDLTMCLLCFAGFLRFNELSNILCSDVKIFSDYFSLLIRKSKTDQYRYGNEVVISRGKTSACPLNMLQKYIALGGIDLTKEEFLFKQVCRSGSTCKLIYKNRPLSYTGAREAILKRLRLVADVEKLGLHSFRAGGASVAANHDISDRCLKRHGRWKCDSSKDGYVADSIEKRLKVTQNLGI